MSLFISVSVAPSPMPSTSWRSMNMVKWIKARVNVEDGGGQEWPEVFCLG